MRLLFLFKSSNKNTTYNKNTTNKKLLLNVSFNSNQPSNDPTIGWKKKNKEPMLASINSNPLFQRKKAPAVETTPKYTTPNITYVFTVSIEFDCSSHSIKV